MSQEADFTDSQANTQTQNDSFDLTPFSEISPIDEKWGHLIAYEVSERRFGIRNIMDYSYTEKGKFDLTKNRTTIGRNRADISISNLKILPANKLDEVSSQHFVIVNSDIDNDHCPVYLEDLSTNGTYVQKSSRSTENSTKEKVTMSCNMIKQRILTNDDMIFVQTKPSIAFKFNLLRKTTNDLPTDINRKYFVGRLLGCGAFGEVYHCINLRDCKQYAVKYSNDISNSNSIEKEMKILRSLKHPCIIQMYNQSTYSDSIAIFLEFMAGGDLIDRIKSKESLSESLTKFYLYQICCAIDYLHNKNITHRDLKPDNILLASSDDECLVKIADFGLSKHIQSRTIMETQCGTYHYMAPEINNSTTGTGYTNKVDIWSLGVILFNCLSGRYPSYSDSDRNSVRFGNDWLYVSQDVKKIIRDALQINPANRITIQHIINHRWLSKDDENIQKAYKMMQDEQNNLR